MYACVCACVDVYRCISDLQTKLVEEVIQEVFGAVHHTVVEVASGDVMEQCPGGWRSFLSPETVKLLVSVNGHLKGQQCQHHQVILRRDKANVNNRVMLYWTSFYYSGI